MPYVLKPFSELADAPAKVLPQAAKILLGHPGGAQGALFDAVLMSIEENAATDIEHALERARDSVEIEWGSRSDGAVLDESEWDAELDKAIAVELAPLAVAIGGTQFAMHAIGVGFGAGAVTADEIAAELARHVANRAKAEGEAAGPGRWLSALGLTVAMLEGAPPAEPTHPPMPAANKAPPLPGSPAAAKPSGDDEGRAFRALRRAVDFDAGSVAKLLDCSAGSLRNYMAGTTNPRKPLTLTQAQRLHADCLARMAALQEAAEVFGAVTG